MSVTSGFFNSVNGDRKYSAEQFSELINTLVTDGVFQNVGTAFAVTAEGGSSSNITVGVGRAWFNGVWVYNDALLPMTVRSAELLLNRIDAVVIEINKSESVRSASIRFVTGAPATEPERPAMTHSDGVDQYPLAYIYRTAQLDRVVQADITNMIGTSSCPYITGILETQNIDNVVAQWENEFDIWFEGIQGQLDGDVATNLANQVLSMQAKFNELAQYRTVSSELQDSQGNVITDQSNSVIYGVTAFKSSEENENNNVIMSAEDEMKIGDIMYTVRKNPGVEWALCNGATLNREEYSELSEHLPFDFNSPWSTQALSTNSSFSDYPSYDTKHRSKIIKLNGLYCVLYMDYASTSTTNRYVKIAYAGSLDGPWTIVNPFSESPSGKHVYPVDLIYANGYYILLTYHNVIDGAQSVVVSRANSLDGPWSDSTVTTTSVGGLTPKKISYGNGYYTVLYNQTDNNFMYYVYVAYTQDITNNIWTSKQIASVQGYQNANQYVAYDMLFSEKESKFVIAMNYQSGNSSNYSASSQIRYATSPDSWTTKTIFSESSIKRGSGWGFRTINYVNGMYIATIYTTSGMRLASCATITGDWTIHDIIPASVIAYYENMESMRVGYFHNKYCLGGSYSSSERCARVIWSDSLSGPWEYIDLASTSIVGANSNNSSKYNMRIEYLYASDDEECGLILLPPGTLVSAYTYMLYSLSANKITLPTISPEDIAYAFIKIRG